jgi:transcriptional regulator with XRE-family HTH domain
MINYQAVGAKLKQVRLRKGLTQEKLAELSNISTTYIGVLEGGHKKPSLETLVKICGTLEVSIDYLLSDSTAISGESGMPELLSAVKGLSSKDMDMIIDVVTAMALHMRKGKK